MWNAAHATVSGNIWNVQKCLKQIAGLVGMVKRKTGKKKKHADTERTVLLSFFVCIFFLFHLSARSTSNVQKCFLKN